MSKIVRRQNIVVCQISLVEETHQKTRPQTDTVDIGTPKIAHGRWTESETDVFGCVVSGSHTRALTPLCGCNVRCGCACV
jgi:hypothetical protein